MSERGLEIAAGVWEQLELDDATHWQEVVALNREFVGGLIAEGLAGHAGEADAAAVIRGWTFPLSGLELSMIEVSRAELEAEQERLTPF